MRETWMTMKQKLRQPQHHRSLLKKITPRPSAVTLIAPSNFFCRPLMQTTNTHVRLSEGCREGYNKTHFTLGKALQDSTKAVYSPKQH